MEDKRHCPHCGEPIYKRPYLMSMDSESEPNELGVALRRVAWLIVSVLVVAIYMHYH